MSHVALAAIGIGPFDTDWLSAVLVLTTPLLLAGVGELISERAGVLNVGIEGFMLAGAFCSFFVAWKAHSLALGLLAGAGGGLLFAAVMAVLSVELRADQIVAGVGINLAVAGLTGYVFVEIFGNLPQVVLPSAGALRIPGLARIPDFGPALFDHNWTVYFAFLLVPICSFLLFRTKWGMAIRSVGELPIASDTVGISVRKVRWMSVLACGALTGFAGANLAVVQVGAFEQEMTAGRGFLALVAVIFGRWRPLGVLGACIALGGTEALELRLAAHHNVAAAVWGAATVIAAALAVYWVLRTRRGKSHGRSATVAALVAVAGVALTVVEPRVHLPNQFWISLPYLVALAVLAGAVTRGRMPDKLTQNYARGEG